MKRVIQVDENLYFEYEACLDQRIQKRTDTELPQEAVEQYTNNDAPLERGIVTGMHIPFKQVRLRGQINPLKPPVHVETVLIGRALGQQTGYVFGVGFRICEDGCVEGEFLSGAEMFKSFGEFYDAVRSRVRRFASSLED